MKKLWNWFKSLFCTTVKNVIQDMVNDPTNKAQAITLAKSLMSSGKTNEARLAEFNAQMKAWAKAAGKQLTDAAINALRENAVVALKGE